MTIHCANKNCCNLILSNEANKFIATGAHGYRNKHTSYTEYRFCSMECRTEFKKFNICHECSQDGAYSTLSFIEKLDYSLCNSRQDCNPSCHVKYQLYNRFIDDYNANTSTFYQIEYNFHKVTLCNIPRDDTYLDIYNVISEHCKISYDMLYDLYHLHDTYELRDRNIITDDTQCCITCKRPYEHVDKNKCISCAKDLLGTCYYVNNGTINGITCCGITSDIRNADMWTKYTYNGDECYIIKLYAN
jgi:hypothetical protein